MNGFLPRSSHAGRRPRPARSRRGAALVVILCLVVLLTFLVVALLVRSLDARRIESASAGGLQADLIARDAVRIVVDDLMKEVEAGSQASSLEEFFVPTGAEAMLPARVLADEEMEADSRFDRLVKQSGAGRFFPDSAPYAATPGPLLDFASAVPTSERAANGRLLSAQRWNGPRLLTGDGFASADELPRWVHVDKDLGPIEAAAASRELTGRFAFNVYDIGGLLDLNVQGAPDGRSPAAIVGTPGGVEPRRFSAATPTGGALGWRSASTGQTDASLSEYLHGAGPRSGFLSTPGGDRRFLTRRDLILAADGRFPGLDDALPFLTHFSRAVASPGLTASAAPTAVNPHPAGVRHANAATLTTYTLEGAPLTYSVQAGDPLMTHRFSLDRLQWLTPGGPTTSEREAAIRACFGLRWNAADKRWEFIGSDGGSSVLNAIPTLAEVATRDREPNFYEILKAAILEGSLGNSATEQTLSPGADIYDEQKDLQILRIGANIIDSGDADNFPTRIVMTQNEENVTVAGIEDLPYLWGSFAIALVVYGPNPDGLSPPQYPRHRADIVMTPHLFNPHAQSPSAASSGPGEIRVRMQGSLTRVQLRSAATSGGAGGDSYYTFTGPAVDLSTKQAITLPITSTSFRELPDVPKDDASNPARLSLQLPHFSDTAMGFVLLSVAHQEPYPKPVGTSTSPANLRLENANMVLEYWDGAQWIPYDTLTGFENLPSTAISKGTAGSFNILNVGSRVAAAGPPISPLFNNDNLNRSYLPKWDPRTTRFSLSYAPGAQYGGGSNGSANEMPPDTVRFTNDPPFSSWTTASLPSLPEGGLAAAVNPGQVADPDGVVRPADGYLGAGANPLKAGALATARPVVLQRPFRSVGELGYVFRDTPWKTLDFFTDRGGDSALLEYFCTGESVVVDASGAVAKPPVMAGKINLNSAPPEVFQALLANALRDESVSSTQLSATEAAQAAADLAAAPPISSLASIPAWDAIATATLSAEHRTTKRAAEQVSRALGSAGQTRTWNLLIDVIAQSGKFPPGAAGGPLAAFVVEGEARFWVFVAIDRLTGKVVETRFEPPFE